MKIYPLKPCPFCQLSDRVHSLNNQVECSRCEVCVSMSKWQDRLAMVMPGGVYRILGLDRRVTSITHTIGDARVVLDTETVGP